MRAAPLPIPRRQRTAEQAERPASRVSPKQAGTALLCGAFVDGPKHTFHALRHRTRSTLVGAATMMGAGAAMQAVGRDPTVLMLGLSAGAVLFDVARNAKAITQASGTERWRAVGESAVWPVLLSGGFSVAGAVLEPHHPVHVDWNHNPGGAAVAVGQAGVQSGVLAFDAPALVNTALDGGGARPASHPGAAAGELESTVDVQPT